MNIYKNLCTLVVTGWLAFHAWEHFKPGPDLVEQERVTKIIVGDPHGGPDVVLWKEN